MFGRLATEGGAHRRRGCLLDPLHRGIPFAALCRERAAVSGIITRNHVAEGDVDPDAAGVPIDGDVCWGNSLRRTCMHIQQEVWNMAANTCNNRGMAPVVASLLSAHPLAIEDPCLKSSENEP